MQLGGCPAVLDHEMHAVHRRNDDRLPAIIADACPRPPVSTGTSPVRCDCWVVDRVPLRLVDCGASIESGLWALSVETVGDGEEILEERVKIVSRFDRGDR